MAKTKTTDSTPKKPKSWGTSDDRKLAELFRKGPRRGGISSTDFKPDTIRSIIERFFPSRSYDSFAPLFRRKARAWNLNKELAGARKAKNGGEEGVTGLEDDESDDEDFEDNGEEDIDLEGFEEEDLEEEEEADSSDERDAKMPPKKKTPKKSPARPKKTAKPPPSDADDLADGVAGLNLGGKKVLEYSMDFKVPFLMYSHTVDRRDHCTIEFYVPTQLKSEFRPRRDETDKSKLLFGAVVPQMIANPGRLNVVHTGDQEFNESTHRNTSFKKLCEKITKDHEDPHGREEHPIFIGDPQEIVLPFPCEDEFIWEVQYYPPNNDTLTDALGAQQFLALVKVELQSTIKPKNRNRGRAVIIGAPIANPDEENNENDDAMQEEEDDPDL